MSANEIAQSDRRSTITRCSHPQLVAMRFGRRVNELQHQIELAWLGVGDAGHRVGELWHDLLLLSRGLTNDEIQRESWAAKLRDAQDYWDSVFQAEWHVDNHCIMRHDLTLIQRGLIANSRARAVAEVLEEAIAVIPALLANLDHTLVMNFDNQHKEVMSFGHRLDQLIHPRHPHRLIVVRLTSDNIPHAGWEAPPLAQVVSTAYEIEMRLTNPRVTNESIVELQLRWEQLGLQGSAFPAVQSDLDAEDVTNRIETAMLREAAVGDPVSPAAEVGYLGLVIAGIRVRREGYGAVEVTSRLGLAVLQRLVSSGSRPTSYQDLSDDWEAMGGNEASPEQVTVRTLLGRLRETLRPLGVNVRNVRGLGWRLDESANSPV